MDHLENIPDDFESPAEEIPISQDDADDDRVRAELASARSDGEGTIGFAAEADDKGREPGASSGDVARGDKLRPYESPPVNSNSSPTVGVFDSGIGGFTVASAILKRRPDLNLVYYADSLNLPYGGREQAQLERFAGSIIDFLLTRGIDLLADGCNTSQSALSSGELRSYHVPAYDLVTCTIDALRGKRLPQSLAILATEATVRAGWWERRLREAFPDIPVHAVAAPELVPLIEAPQQDEHALRHAVGKYIREVRETGADTVVLGCTHYPLVQPLMLETDVYLRYIDPAQCLADKVAADLSRTEGAGPSPRPADAMGDSGRGQGPTPSIDFTGSLQFFNSKPSERFYAMGERVFGREIRGLTKVYIVNPYED